MSSATKVLGEGARLLLVIALAAVMGCAGPAHVPEGRSSAAGSAALLRPWFSIAAVRFVAATDPLGIPLPRAPAQLGHLVRPLSAATSGNDVYLLDAGLNGLYRYTFGMDALVRVGNVGAVTGAKVRVLGDHTLLVLDPVGRRVLRLDRTGRVLRTYADESNLRQPVSLAVDEAEQLLFVADAAVARIVAFRLGSGAAFPIVPIATERDRVHAIGAIAAAERVLHIVDPVMRQVVVLTYDGRILRVYGHADLVRPSAVAVDAQGRAWVLDEAQPVLKVFEAGRLLPPLQGVGAALVGATDVVIDGNVVTISEAGASRVQLMRLTSGAGGAR